MTVIIKRRFHTFFFWNKLSPSLSLTAATISATRFQISARDNQYGRKYEGLLGIEQYFARVIEAIEKNDRQKLS